MQLYADPEPNRADVDRWRGTVVLEFGAPWCGYCLAAQPAIRQALDSRELRHVQVEDAKGRPLGRSFGVKLWPTLIFLKDGREVARVVRPRDADEIAAALAAAEDDQL